MIEMNEPILRVNVGIDVRTFDSNMYVLYFLTSSSQEFGKIGGATNKFITRTISSINICVLSP